MEEVEESSPTQVNVNVNVNANVGEQSKTTSSPKHKKPNAKQSIISVLPQQVVDLIAAGEVVQRPVAVVKELVENSIDAKATNIQVHVEKGGLIKLEIKDNGVGISSHDLELAATRHATSKLQTVQDFQELQTLGFRGEGKFGNHRSRAPQLPRPINHNLLFT